MPIWFIALAAIMFAVTIIRLRRASDDPNDDIDDRDVTGF